MTAAGKTYHLCFDNAFGLTKGGDFKVARRPGREDHAFKVREVNGRPLAEVTAEVTEPGLADLRRDAHCEIRPQSLIGEYFVDCQPAPASGCPTAAGCPSSAPARRSPIDLVNDIMRRPTASACG